MIDLREGDRPDMRYEIADLLNRNPIGFYLIAMFPDKAEVVISENIPLPALAGLLRGLADQYDAVDK